MSFFHSQNVIDPEFFFPAFYDETVCIKPVSYTHLDSAQIITPFVRVGTYPTRNFATLGPL